jgi:hypothetical protein
VDAQKQNLGAVRAAARLAREDFEVEVTACTLEEIRRIDVPHGLARRGRRGDDQADECGNSGNRSAHRSLFPQTWDGPRNAVSQSATQRVRFPAAWWEGH